MPFATGLVRRSRRGSLVHGDLNEVVKLLWRAAYERFMATRRGQGADVKFRRDVAWHKRDEEEVRGVQYVTARCATNRPAFRVLTQGQVTGADTVLLYMYCAMGLPGAHEQQQTVLARVSNLELAAALMKAALICFIVCTLRNVLPARMQSSWQSGPCASMNRDSRRAVRCGTWAKRHAKLFRTRCAGTLRPGICSCLR